MPIARPERRRRVAVLASGEDALHQLPAGRDARLTALEEQRQQVFGAGLVAGGGGIHVVVGEAVHILAALRSGARERETSHEPRPDEHELLRHEPAEREGQQVDLAQLERLEEPQRVVRHGGHRARCVAGRSADAGVVERDHLAHRGEGVDERGVPVVEVARKCCSSTAPGVRRMDQAGLGIEERCSPYAMG
jgi:hypothetical protein